MSPRTPNWSLFYSQPFLDLCAMSAWTTPHSAFGFDCLHIAPMKAISGGLSEKSSSLMVRYEPAFYFGDGCQPPRCQPPLKCQPVDKVDGERFASDCILRHSVPLFQNISENRSKSVRVPAMSRGLKRDEIVNVFRRPLQCYIHGQR